MTDQPHPVDIHVGKRLRLRRTILGMSQESLGTAIGITFQQVQKYERGTNRMGSSRLFEFAKLLGVPVGYFFEAYGTDDAYPTASAPAGMAGMAEPEMPSFDHEQLTSRETMEMMRAYYKIPSTKVRKSIFDLMKTLAENTGK